MSRPHTYVDKYFAEIQCGANNGISKREKQSVIFEKYANLKYKQGSRHFWCRGYYVDTVGKNKKVIQEYIRNQLQEDMNYEQLTLREIVDSFTGEPVKGNK